MIFKIPFCKTTLGEEEINAIAEVIRGGWVVMGKKTQEFEEAFANYVGGKYAVFVDSGTSALDLSLKWHLHIESLKRGDLVCVPSMTFTSSAEVIVNNGLKPSFLDVQKDDFCLHPMHEVYNVIAVHLTGNECFLQGEKVTIEDSAHRIERGQCKDNPNLVCFSFYATKNISTINGGMIVTNDEIAYKWLKKARDHGISKGTTERYKDGQWVYSIEFVGWREKSDDVHAVIGLEQLKKLDEFNKERQRCISLYNELLGLNRSGLHLYPILVNERPKFIEFMRNKGIQVSVHFLPLHLMPAYQEWRPRGYYDSINNVWVNTMENTEYLGEHLCSLPLYPQLTNEEIKEIVEYVKESNLFINE